MRNGMVFVYLKIYSSAIQTNILIISDLPYAAAKSSAVYQKLFNFNNSNEVLFSVQAKAVSILLTSFELWENQAGFIVHLDDGRSFIKRCHSGQGKEEENCDFEAYLVSHWIF